jgi:hypothetical protein
MGRLMTEKNWTLDPEINDSMEDFELPPADFFEQLMAERAPIEAGASKPGEPAPAFSAERLSNEGELSGEQVCLDDFRGRYLALLFGSITCPIYRGQIQRFNKIFAEFDDRLAFLLIYTHEAHPDDGWQVAVNLAQNVVYKQPNSCDQRAELAATCIQQYAIDMPVAVDDMNDSIERLYAGTPERLYLIGPDGIVLHRSTPGPFMLDVIDAWYHALQQATEQLQGQ